MRGRRREPVPISRVVGSVLDEMGLATAARGVEIARRWGEIAGPAIAAHSRPVAVRGPVLEIEVESSVWSHQLQLQRETLLDALRQQLGDEAPTDLRFHLGYTRRS